MLNESEHYSTDDNRELITDDAIVSRALRVPSFSLVLQLKLVRTKSIVAHDDGLSFIYILCMMGSLMAGVPVMIDSMNKRAI